MTKKIKIPDEKPEGDDQYTDDVLCSRCNRPATIICSKCHKKEFTCECAPFEFVL